MGIKLLRWKKYRGFRRVGTAEIDKEDRDTHLRRASWLTAMVESNGKFGCVITFDGTSGTFGLHQAILVYPRELLHPDKNLLNDQGIGFKLLNMVRPYCPEAELWDHIEAAGWIIGRDNKVRYIENGRPVSGFDIRQEVMGSAQGVTPVRGRLRKQAQRWVELFADVFDNEDTFDVQEEFGMEHFAKRADRARMRFCRSRALKKLTVDDIAYEDTSIDLATFEDEPAWDLAWSLFWSHSTNAPGMSLKVLCRALPRMRRMKTKRAQAKVLIAKLANTKYGRWHEDIKGGRWDRTRKYAMKSGFWPDDLFKGKHAVMPRYCP